MLSIDTLVKESTGLPDKYVEMAVNYIQFLQYQCDLEQRNVGYPVLFLQFPYIMK